MASPSLIAKLGVDTSSLKSGLGKGAGGAAGMVAKFGAAATAAVAAAFVAAGAAVAAFVVKGTKEFAKFEKGMKEVFTLIPEASDKMRQGLMDDTRELSKAFGTDLTDNVKGLYQALSAGVPADNVMEFMKVASKAAIGGVASLEESVAAITTVINGYGEENMNAQRAADVLFTTVKGGVTTFSELSSEIGKATPIAAALGVEFEEVSGMFQVLTKKLGAGKTAEAGTAIKSMLVEIADGGKQAGQAFERLAGQSFRDFIASGGDVETALQILKNASDEAGITIDQMFGNIRGGQGALMLAAEGLDNLSEATEKAENATGATAAAFEEISDSLDAEWSRAVANFKDNMISAGEALRGVGIKTLPLATNAMKAFASQINEGIVQLMGTTDASSASVNAFKILIKIYGSLFTAVKQVVAAWKLYFEVYKAFAEYLIDITSAIFTPLIKALKGTGTALAAFFKAMKDPFNVDNWTALKDTIGGTLDEVMDAFKETPSRIKGALKKGGKNLKEAFGEFKDATKKNAKELVDIWSEKGKFSFLSEEEAKKAAKSQEQIKKAVEKTAEEVGKENEERKKQEAFRKKAIEDAKKRAQQEQRLKQIEAQKAAIAAQQKFLMEKKKAIAAAILARQKAINEELKKEVGVHDKALGIVDKLLQRKDLDKKKRQALLDIEKKLAKARQAAFDATEEGQRLLKEEKAALELIMKTEKDRFMERAKAEGKGRLTREKHWKEHKHKLDEIEKAHGNIERRMKAAKGVIDQKNRAMGALNVKVKKGANEFQNIKVEVGEANDKLAEVGEQMEALQSQGSSLDVEARGFEQAPDQMDEATTKLKEFNDLAANNDLVKIAKGDLKIDGGDLRVKEVERELKVQTKRLSNINQTLKGKFVNQ